MISFIKGRAVDFTEGSVIVETPSGIGFEVFMSGNALSQIRTGQELKLHTHFNVKEDAMQLYGFFTKDELQIFKYLIAVNGLGPKGAIAILGGLGVDDLRFAVLSDDVKAICKAPGVGKKTAQKLILELKDKFKLEEAFESKLAKSLGEADGMLPTASTDARQEAVEALTALGYGASEAYQAVKKIEPSEDEDVETLLKKALKNL